MDAVNKKIHAMVDIETLDTAPTTVVASIGIITFQLGTGDVTEKYYHLDIQPQLDAGRTVSESTLRWWFKQDSLVQQSTFCQETTSPLEVIQSLDKCLGKDTLLWGYGATFDNVVLKHLAESLGAPLSHKYRNDRCFRTLVGMFDPGHELRPENSLKHDALADTKNQVEWFRNIVNVYDLEEKVG